MDIVRIISDLDEDVDLHVARLLVLINAFGTDNNSAQIEGLTKLAKLDFLLRYPTMLETALEAKGRTIRGVDVESYERSSVESKMVRYRFGPWDHRYREFLNIMVGKGLLSVTLQGRTVIISSTPLGRSTAQEIAGNPIFADYQKRSEILKRHFDLSATNLMKFIYETFPEVTSLRSNEEISV